MLLLTAFGMVPLIMESDASREKQHRDQDDENSFNGGHFQGRFLPIIPKKMHLKSLNGFHLYQP